MDGATALLAMYELAAKQFEEVGILSCCIVAAGNCDYRIVLVNRMEKAIDEVCFFIVGLVGKSVLIGPSQDLGPNADYTPAIEDYGYHVVARYAQR